MKICSFFLNASLFFVVMTIQGQTTISYNLGNQSTFTNTGVQWDPVTSNTSPDGKVRTNVLNTLWHSTGYGVSFQTGNSLEIDVEGTNSTIRFYGSVYSSGSMNGGTNPGGSELGSIDVDLDNHPGMADQTGYYEFVYQGGPTTLYFTFTGANAYTPVIEVTNQETSVIITDVWDFGAVQLDPVLYNNMLSESIINSWYDIAVAPGTSGVNLPSFTAGDLGYVTNGTSDRLRTTNSNLTRWDDNIASSANFTGRVYVNSGSNTGRYLTLNLAEDDEVTINARSDAGGTLNFIYVPDPLAQTDQIAIPASEIEVNFVAKSAGEYRVFDTTGKPSYFRVSRKAANYISITGTIDETQAPNIPGGYELYFTNAAGKVVSAPVSSGTYSVILPADYTYELSLAGANGYIITNGNTLNVTESTTTHDVTILQVDLYHLSGNITGLSDLTNLALYFIPDPIANSIYTPVVTINIGTSTYSVDLEAGIEYTISADGVNDYEILANTITIGTADDTAVVAFSPKPLYTITINTPDLNDSQRAALTLTFTNNDEDGYSYTVPDVSTVALRDGVYSISYGGLDVYPIELALTSNLTVQGSNTTKTLEFTQVTQWLFNDRVINAATAYKGLIFTGSVNVRGGNGDLNVGNGATITIPVQVGDKLIIKDYYQSNYSVEGGPTITNTSNSTSTSITSEYIYPGSTDGTITITAGGTSYFRSFDVVGIVPYTSIVTVGVDKEYQTIMAALNAISRMERPNDELVTVMIDPGNYEEMLVIDGNNITLKNASTNPSIALLNQGVDIESNAVRITSYYGQKYNFFSQGTDNKWNADALAVNTANGYTEYVNQEGTGGGSSYWNATIVVKAVDVTLENVIIENSFNQYISLKESLDIVVPKSVSEPERPTNYGNTTVQNRALGFVTQAAAIGIAASADRVFLKECRVIGRQDSFYGASGSRVAVYKGAMMGAVDYLFGGMTAVFYQTDLVLNTSDSGNDAAYITAAQQTTGRGFLMYECHVKSTVPGLETASVNGAKPGYFGRPWAPNTSEVVFYNTTIDESTYPGSVGMSLISPLGWTSSLGGESAKMYEYGTIENASGIDNSGSRAPWSTILSTPILTDGTNISTFNFTKGNDNWDPFASLSINELPGNLSFSPIVKAYNQKLYITNIHSKTEIKIYNMTGVLYNEFKTNTDMSIEIPNGLWVIKINSIEGFKSVKLLAH